MSQLVKCKACGKQVSHECLLRHIAQKNDCKSVYGQDFVDNWKRENAKKSKKQYKEKNKEAVKEQNAAYKLENKEQISAMNADYYERNKNKFQKRQLERRKVKKARELRQSWHDYFKSSLFDLEKDTREQNSMKKEETYHCLEKAFAQFPKLCFAMLYIKFEGKIEETYKQLEEDCDSMFERVKVMDEDNYEEVEKLYDELPPKVEGDYCGYGPVPNWQDATTDQLEVSYSKVWVDGLSQQVMNKWHDMQLQIDTKMEVIAEKNGQRYHCFDCKCKKCKLARKASKVATSNKEEKDLPKVDSSTSNCIKKPINTTVVNLEGRKHGCNCKQFCSFEGKQELH